MQDEWLHFWYEPKDSDRIVYMTLQEIAGAAEKIPASQASDTQVAQGLAVLMRWCRLNCSVIPRMVNVKGDTGLSFNNVSDAVLFKMVWGGKHG